MKKTLLKWAIFLGVMVILFTGSIYALFQLNPNRHKEKLIQLAEKNLNLKINFDLIYPIIYPGLGFEIKNLFLSFPDTDRIRKKLFKASSIKFVLDLKSLVFARAVKFREIILIKPEFYYEISPQETKRFKNILKKSPSSFSNNQNPKPLIKRLKNFVKIDPNDLLKPTRIYIHRARATIYDLRPNKRRLPAPLEFGNVSLELKNLSKHNFSLWTQAEYPFFANGDGYGLIFTAKGKGRFSFKPFYFSIEINNAFYGENPIEKIFFGIKKENGKIKFRAEFKGEFDLTDLPVILSWKAIKYSPRQDKIRIWGKAKYQIHFQSADSIWAKFFNLDQVNVDNFGIVLVDPATTPTRLKAPLILDGLKIKVSNVYGENPGDISIDFLFPPQASRSKSVPVNLKGKISFSSHCREINLQTEKAYWGKNLIEKFVFNFSRSLGKYSLKGDLKIKLKDLSQFKPVITWSPFLFSQQAYYMNFGGKGELEFRFSYPKSEKEKVLDYNGIAFLQEATFDPGMVIAPVENFRGKISIARAKITSPLSFFSISHMPMKSSISFTYPGYPLLEFNTTSTRLHLSRLFLIRPQPSSIPLKVGEKLPPTTIVLQGSLTSLKVNYHQFRAKQVKGNWKFKDRVVGFDSLTFYYRNGKYQDEGSWVDFRQARIVDIHFKGKFRDFRFRKVMKELFGYDFFVDGRASGTGYLSARLIDGSLDLKSLNGYFDLKIKNVKFIGYNLGVRILKFLGFKIDEKKYSLDFERAKTKLIIKNGVIYLDDLELRSWNIEAHCFGWVDLVEQKLKLYVAAYPLEAVATFTKPLPLLGALINQLQEALFGSYAKAEGKWTDIRINPYLPIVEPPPKPPEKPEFPQRPW